MLDKLLRVYKDIPWFEFGNGFICGTDRITFTTVFDPRFQGFPDGNIETEDMKRLVKAQSFGLDSMGSLWIESNGEKEFIKIYPSHGFNQKVAKKSTGKPTFQSDELAKTIRKIKPADAQFLVFQGSKTEIKTRIFYSDETFIEMNVPESFDQRLLYDWKLLQVRYKWELVKRVFKLKNVNENPEFSIIKFGGDVYPLWMHWPDCDVYIANHT